jgi:succinate-acetate transporter protein
MKPAESAAPSAVISGTPISLRQARAVAASIVRDTTANPAPLGMMGFGLTTILINLGHVGAVPSGSMVLALGILCGGVAQLVAGVMEWRKRNTFGTVAFIGYGLFWLSLGALLSSTRLGFTSQGDRSGMAAYLFVWGLFSVVLSVATLKMNRAVMGVFFALTLLFFLLAVADATASERIQRIAGWEGILCGLGAIYVGAAQIVNEVWRRNVLPLGTLD